MNWKNYLKIGGVILIAGGLIWGGFYIWEKLTAPGGLLSSEENQYPPITDLTSSLKALTEDKIFDYWINSATGDVYYLNTSGQIYKIPSGGKTSAVNEQTINQLNNIKVSPDGTLMVAKFNYPDAPTFSIFDTVANTWSVLPQNIISVAWSPNSQQLAFLENNDSAGRLAIYTVASKKTEEVIKMTQKDLELSWVKNNEIYLSQTPSFDLPTSLFSIDLTTKIIKPLIRNEYGLDIMWSRNSDLGVKLNNSSRVPQISLIDNSGNELANVSFNTLPEKCMIDQTKIYCGVPKNFPTGLKFPDDYRKHAVYFQDELYLINLAEQKGTSVFNNRDNIFIDAYRLSTTNNQLLFINRYDQRLYSLLLK